MTPLYALHRYGYSLLAQRFDKPGCSHSTAWVKWVPVTIFFFSFFFYLPLPSSSLSPSSPFHSTDPPSTPHFVANLPALPVQIDKFNQLQKNKWKRENEACEGDNLCRGERCGWLACRQVMAWQTFRIMEIVSELKKKQKTKKGMVWDKIERPRLNACIGHW